jgi:hypothetical protein
MIDMLVRLYDLPDSTPLYAQVAAHGVTLRRARAFEKHTVAAFAREHFSEKWASEVEVALSRQPVALEALRELGHAYGIIGGVGPAEFYAKACGAIEIPGSDPGTYVDLLP